MPASLSTQIHSVRSITNAWELTQNRIPIAFVWIEKAPEGHVCYVLPEVKALRATRLVAVNAQEALLDSISAHDGHRQVQIALRALHAALF